MRFNPRPRAGGDPIRSAYSRTVSSFQSTPPREGRLSETSTSRIDSRFNPRPRARGDWQFLAFCFEWYSFNPRPRARGDSNNELRAAPCWPFQSTPPREGRLVLRRVHRFEHLVSIHAPAWGATERKSMPQTVLYSFNPRPRARGDALVRRVRLRGYVSIHAPARGATATSRYGARNIIVSIHAPARGATGFLSFGVLSGAVSIHAPARGATRACHADRRTMASFNPRPRARGDRCVDRCRHRLRCVSIHAPAWGATRWTPW